MIEWKNKYCPTFINGEEWGVAHPNPTRHFWYDQEMVSTTDDGRVLVFDIQKNPRYFEEVGQVKDWGIGCITSTKTFKYGTFWFEYELPVGAYLWPAIWLSSSLRWPPEIDIMEGWSGNGWFCKGKPNYRRFPFFNNIHPGLIYMDGEKQVGQGYGCFGSDRATYGWCQPLDNLCTCKLVWAPDVIEFYYNYHRIASIKERDTLSKFIDPMYLKFDLFLSEEFSDDQYKWYKENGRPFRVIDFVYTPLSGGAADNSSSNALVTSV